MNKKNLGKFGETIAANYLRKNGYKILYKNWRYKKRELDLITFYKGKIVFIEVKTRQQVYLISEVLKHQQIINLQKAGQEFCYQKKLNWENIRFDLILIIINTFFHQITIKHLKKII